MTTPTLIEILATVFFALAILHTFSVQKIQSFSHDRFASGSMGRNLFHYLGEVEVVFGFWAGLFAIAYVLVEGGGAFVTKMESLNFTEPAFVFAILAVCSTKPILNFALTLITGISRILPLPRSLAFYVTALVVGPLLGSFITEPAAMTVTALILLQKYYSRGLSTKFMYATLGLLFVNISIGGTLTSFAAPPVLMVAAVWSWDMTFMLTHFGWKGALACVISTAIVSWQFRKEISSVAIDSSGNDKTPSWLIALHLVFLVLVVVTAHHAILFLSLLIFFLGLCSITKKYQSEIKLKEGLLVGFFLGGLVVLGGPQRWWLEPIVTKLGDVALFLGAIGLTGVIDNAAITYLGAQVPDLAESSKYFLVAGSVVGGGLTVIANAPNPAGFGILNGSFGESGISPLGLFRAALIPTLIAALIFGFF